MTNTEMLKDIVRWAMQDEAAAVARLVRLGIPADLVGEHRQQSWAVAERNGVCTTAFCVAGQVVNLSEDYAIDYGFDVADILDLPERPSDGDERQTTDHRGRVTGYATVRAAKYVDHTDKAGVTRKVKVPDLDSEELYFGETGREVLGIDSSQSSRLFAGDNTLWEVWIIAKMIVEGAGDVWDLPEPPLNRNGMIDGSGWITSEFEPSDSRYNRGQHTRDWFMQEMADEFGLIASNG